MKQDNENLPSEKAQKITATGSAVTSRLESIAENAARREIKNICNYAAASTRNAESDARRETAKITNKLKAEFKKVEREQNAALRKLNSSKRKLSEQDYARQLDAIRADAKCRQDQLERRLREEKSQIEDRLNQKKLKILQERDKELQRFKDEYPWAAAECEALK